MNVSLRFAERGDGNGGAVTVSGSDIDRANTRWIRLVDLSGYLSANALMTAF
jgi:hypothetical protein